MSPFWQGACLFVVELILIVVVCLGFQERGYKRGQEEGYRLGRLDSDNWWLGIEAEVKRVRRKIAERKSL